MILRGVIREEPGRLQVVNQPSRYDYYTVLDSVVPQQQQEEYVCEGRRVRWSVRSYLKRKDLVAISIEWSSPMLLLSNRAT